LLLWRRIRHERQSHPRRSGLEAGILPHMQKDTIADWQSLTQLYRKMSDDELCALDADIADLTEVAQQVLRDEMRSRRLDRQRVASEEPNSPESPAATPWNRSADAPPAGGETAESDSPSEYTWKVPLCESDDPERTWQIQEVLRDAGVESWIEGPRSIAALDLGNPRILVAADQLEQANAILARPIPQAIVDQSKMQMPDFESPACPGCGAKEPVLVSVNPLNTWRCETCGKQWTDSAEEK
jgi:hypothetical protein